MVLHKQSSILFSRRACWVGSLLTAAGSLLLAVLAVLRSAGVNPISLFVFIAGVSSELIGQTFAWFFNRVIITRLKLRYPAKEKAIESAAPPYVKLLNPILSPDAAKRFVAEDPEADQLLAELQAPYAFGRIWTFAVPACLFAFCIMALFIPALR